MIFRYVCMILRYASENDPVQEEKVIMHEKEGIIVEVMSQNRSKEAGSRVQCGKYRALGRNFYSVLMRNSGGEGRLLVGR